MIAIINVINIDIIDMDIMLLVILISLRLILLSTDADSIVDLKWISLINANFTHMFLNYWMF